MKQKNKKLIIGLLIFSMMAMYGSVPTARALSMTQSKDLISDSDNSAVSSHTFTFTIATALTQNQKVVITFPGGFTGLNASNAVCPDSAVASVVSQDLVCTAGAGGISSGTKTVSITGVTNPSGTGSYLIQLRTKTAADVVIEEADVMVAILGHITMTATVSATLQFTVSGTSTGVMINGIPTSNTSTATTTPFGTLVVGATSTVGQDLSVITNADNGYVVTVYEDSELTNTTGSTINSFDNSADTTGSTTPHTWTAPLGILDQTWTYGHMGLTSDDSNLGTTDTGNDPMYDFTGKKFVGLNGTSTQMIMKHTGPADGQTQDKGYASVLYQVQIHALQEAGDYTNTLTYICTPTY